MRVLSDAAVGSLLSLDDLLPTVETAFLKQGRGEVERPDRPHFPLGVGLDPEEARAGADADDDESATNTGTDADGDDAPTARVGTDEPLGTGLTMPAYVHGDRTYATKLASVHPGNTDHSLPTIHAQLVVADAATGEPLALMDAERITGARTGCIGGLAVRHLAPGDGELDVGVLGAGTQARWQTRAIDATRGVDRLRVYSPNSRAACAADLRDEGIPAEAVDSPRKAVEGADCVVTATTSHEPVFPGEALADDALVVAVGAYTAEMRELDRETMARADRLFADVPEEVAEVGDVAENGADPDSLEPLSDVFAGERSRDESDGVIVVESVGTAVLDAATGDHLYALAEERDAGTTVAL